MEKAQLIEELQRLPLRPNSVTRVLAVLEDPRTCASTVANALAPDVSLCARILHLANSPYFGASGRIGSLERAVVTLGNSVIRSLAITTAAGLLGSASRVPTGFWVHSGAVGVGASHLAARFGLPSADALCAGLLHDLGGALAYQYDATIYADIAALPADQMLARECHRFGTDHAQLGGIALAAWRLPSTVVDAVASHHRGLEDDAAPLTRAVLAAEALVHATMGGAGAMGNEPIGDPEATLYRAGITGADLEDLGARVAEDADHIAALAIPA